MLNLCYLLIFVTGHVGEKQREIQDKNDSCSPAQKRLAGKFSIYLFKIMMGSQKATTRYFKEQ